MPLKLVYCMMITGKL